MSAFRWIEQDDQHESLAAALRSVLASRGREVSYDQLIALLGLGTLLTASNDEPVEAWPHLARDGALVAACRLLGVQVRELHPPAAADGLRDSSEFSLHFTDSYLPLIEKALAVGQAVLAWRGWPPPRDQYWGVITQANTSLISGYTLGHGGEPVPLIGPAHQVYVVEAVAARADASPEGMLEHVAATLINQQEGRWPRALAVRTGGAAMRGWLTACFRAANIGDELAAAQAAMLRSLSKSVSQALSNRRALRAWLCSPAAGAGRGVVAAWVDALDASIESLRTAEQEIGRGSLSAAESTKTAIASLVSADLSDRDAAVQLRSIAASQCSPAGGHG